MNSLLSCRTKNPPKWAVSVRAITLERSPCCWIAHVPPPSSPGVRSSASNWTGPGLSGCSAYARTFSNETSPSTTASFRYRSKFREKKRAVLNMNEEIHTHHLKRMAKKKSQWEEIETLVKRTQIIFQNPERFFLRLSIEV